METKYIAYIAAPFAGWIGAQLIKIAIHKKLGFNWQDATQSGGMPSSHAAFMAALASSIAIGEGVDSVAFAISFAISCIVVYDATDVRLTTGQQTDIINKLAAKNGISSRVKHNARGHTIPEAVAGVLLGVIIGIGTAWIL